MPEFTIPADELDEFSFEQLKELADQTGVGYAGLEEEDLRERLKFEGSTT